MMEQAFSQLEKHLPEAPHHQSDHMLPASVASVSPLPKSILKTERRPSSIKSSVMAQLLAGKGDSDDEGDREDHQPHQHQEPYYQESENELSEPRTPTTTTTISYQTRSPGVTPTHSVAVIKETPKKVPKFFSLSLSSFKRKRGSSKPTV
eukprot:GILJ01050238.1.p1 GENE.GILJ01050238.1~~GILJ01050238.1.p1  ORF type:complete len:150 (-),score=15.94 GILJ01050238.1:2-451(-)